jgi:hypothetical protein
MRELVSRLISRPSISALAIFCLVSFGCRQTSQTIFVSAAELKSLRRDYRLPVPENRDVHDLARYLAGMPGAEGSAFQPAEADPAWRLHAAESDRGWKRFLTQRQPRMRAFAQEHLSGKPIAQPALFYPFGGPDIMTAQALFPVASTYVLVGLEPPGSLPDAGMVRESAATYLPGLRGSLGSVLNKSFFVTREMDQQLRGQAADGLLPVMLVGLVRGGNTVRGMLYIALDSEGRWTERGKPVAGRTRGPADGVAVEFADPAGSLHTLVYFSVNLQNAKYKSNVGFHRYLERLGEMTVMFKSASYMPHRDDFDLIRSQVLERASAVVQDDSGLPFRFFTPDAWQVKLYGQYEQPYGSFRYRKQEDLRQAFLDRRQTEELPFSIGYGFGRVKSNLLVARRKS